MDLSSIVAGLGNTVGSFIPYKCPRCGETRPISEYDGNIVDGSAECPSCNKDPSPWATNTNSECKFKDYYNRLAMIKYTTVGLLLQIPYHQ